VFFVYQYNFLVYFIVFLAKPKHKPFFDIEILQMKKLLIIDDDPRNIFALTAVLRARKFVCVSATGIKEGLQVLEANPDIKVLLLDMMMPDMDGYEAIGLLRQYDAYKTLPIVAVTAQAMRGDREKCLAAGADGYISKPVDVDELIKVVDELN
jgi:two-component system cell cycle response regulator DivK